MIEAFTPFGLLCALDEEMNVTQVSENVSDHLSLHVDEVLGRPLAESVDPAGAEEVRSVLREQRWHDANPLGIGACGKRFDGVVHHHEGAAILELEPNPETPEERSIHHPFRAALARAAREHAERACRHHHSGDAANDRIRPRHVLSIPRGRQRLRRRRSEGCGARAVSRIALSRLRHSRAGTQPDLKNSLRLIFDADQKPARIVPALRRDTGAPLDLSFSVLRSVLPIHIEYMKNMGVRASMSISLIVRNRLWGLISCLNHTGPRRVSHRMRSACEFIGRLASLQIAAFEDRELLASRTSRRATEDALRRAMKEATGSVLAALVAQPSALIDLVDAGGVAVVENGEPVTCGGAPPADVIREIARWLDERGDLRPFSSASLGVHFPPALAASEVASGLLTFALPGARLMWFRPEVVQTVNWGGDPTKPVDAEAGKRLRPRHSFALWKEEVRGRSRPWTPSDLEVADELQRCATEVDIERRLSSEQRAVRARDEVLAVVSHDLSNPLSVILLEAAYLLRDLPETGDQRARTLRESVDSIRRATTRMNALIEDLLERATLEEKGFPLDVQPVESRDLLEDAVTDAQPLADAKHISLVLDLNDPPKIEVDPHRISQVLSNLLGNAIKFTPEHGTVTLCARPRHGALSVTIADTGCGIAPEDLAHIFDRYWRPKGSQGGGTGLGLYIARGIVEAHGGRVWAESSPQGATFVFTLPLEPRRD